MVLSIQGQKRGTRKSLESFKIPIINWDSSLYSDWPEMTSLSLTEARAVPIAPSLWPSPSDCKMTASLAGCVTLASSSQFLVI